MGLINRGMGPPPEAPTATTGTAPPIDGQLLGDAMGEQQVPGIEPGEDTIGGEFEGAERATEEEQEAVDRLVLAARKILFENKETRSRVEARLEQGEENLEETIANETVMIVTGIDEKSKGTIPEVAILPAAGQILMEVSEMAKALGLSIDQNVMSHAWQIAEMKLAEQYGVEPREAQELMDSLGQEQVQAMATQQQQFVPTGKAPAAMPAEPTGSEVGPPGEPPGA